MLKIAIAGICGRMGRNLYACLLEEEAVQTMQLSVATTIPGDTSVGKTVGEALGGGSQIPITEQLNDDFDILIDFTSVASTLANIVFCQSHQKAMVIGTTGFDDKQQAFIRQHSQTMPVFMSANMSIGVNIMEQLVATAAKALYRQADIEIVEAHHRHKVDAPSGTALMIGRAIADAIGANLSDRAVFARQGIIGEREEGSIGFSTIRGGDVVGEHTACYYMDGERIEISHRATDRKIFARGALFAADYLSKQGNGFYCMSDALGLEAVK